MAKRKPGSRKSREYGNRENGRIVALIVVGNAEADAGWLSLVDPPGAAYHGQHS
jgi:hypothetical protein